MRHGNERESIFCSTSTDAEELHRLHLPEQERPFEVVQTVHLGIAEYENFVTDLLADRQFIEDYALQCDRGKAWRCLLVRGRGQTGGILVSPEGPLCGLGGMAFWK